MSCGCALRPGRAAGALAASLVSLGLRAGAGRRNGSAPRARRGAARSSPRSASPQRMGLPARELRVAAGARHADGGAACCCCRAAARRSDRRERLQELVAWVEGGGHLIVEAEHPGRRRSAVRAPRRAAHRGASHPPSRAHRAASSGRRLTVSIFQRHELSRRAGARFRQRARCRAARDLRARRGHGDARALGLQFARNRVIGKQDHAEFLWHLLKLQPARRAAGVPRVPQRLSLWGFSKQHAMPALVAARRAGSRCGCGASRRASARCSPTPRRRAGACSTTCARAAATTGRGACARRLVSARATPRCARVTRAQPDFAPASEAERAARVAALAGISTEEAQLLSSPPAATCAAPTSSASCKPRSASTARWKEEPRGMSDEKRATQARATSSRRQRSPRPCAPRSARRWSASAR